MSSLEEVFASRQLVEGPYIESIMHAGALGILSNIPLEFTIMLYPYKCVYIVVFPLIYDVHSFESSMRRLDILS